MIDERAVRAIESSDTDELVRIVDGHCEARSWEALIELRSRLDEAVTRGKQLWGVAEYIRYRLALDAPGEWAGPAVTEGPTRFTLGPLPEVAASTKVWAEIEPYLATGPERAVVAHERVLRGEVLDDAAVDPLVVELPLHLEPWEPTYQVVTYKADKVESATPPAPTPRVVALTEAADTLEDSDATRALLALVEHWVERSNGRAQAACVEGPATAAVHALGVARAGLAEVPADLALAHMAWAASSGGAHARRRGAAAGRSSAWWAASEVAGLEWPPEPAELGAAIAELTWFLWSDGSPNTGWALRLAVESPAEGLAWALTATDAE
ncbi:MAG TPA: DUF6183 family protein [Acidimicrobiia bacterium]|nr:DUF6183 family protein [Acidimicrobiia bacterium]